MVQIIYSMFLMQTAWHDLKKRQIPLWIFLIFGILGFFQLCLPVLPMHAMSGSLCQETGMGQLAAFLPGMLLLGITACTQGAVGPGDGLFFIISACYLPMRGLLFLLTAGLIFCSSFGLGMVIWGSWNGISVRRMRLPFLPFLVPAWFWMLFFW